MSAERWLDGAKGEDAGAWCEAVLLEGRSGRIRSLSLFASSISALPYLSLSTSVEQPSADVGFTRYLRRDPRTYEMCALRPAIRLAFFSTKDPQVRTRDCRPMIIVLVRSLGKRCKCNVLEKAKETHRSARTWFNRSSWVLVAVFEDGGRDARD